MITVYAMRTAVKTEVILQTIPWHCHHKLPQHLQSTDIREQFKHRVKRWLFACAYSRRRVW